MFAPFIIELTKAITLLFTTFHQSSFILLMRSLPSVVAPQIETRVAAYGLFEHLEETFRYLVVGQ